MDEYATHASIPLGTNGAATMPVRALSVAESPFASSGIARVRVTKHGKAQTLEIPIKSIEFEVIEQFVIGDRPRIPKRRENIQGQGWKYVVDETNEEYQLQLANYNRKLSYVAVLMAIDVDIQDVTGKVVWSADNTMTDYDAARTALKQMGLVENQFVTILEAVRELTRDDEEFADQD